MKSLNYTISVFFLLIVLRITKGSLVWLASCSNDDDCRNLKNATCMNGLCNCGEKFKVCEYVTNNKSVNLIGSKCNESKNCNIIFVECHEMKKECVCKDGFIASNDFMTCLKVGKQVSDTGGKPDMSPPSCSHSGNKCNGSSSINKIRAYVVFASLLVFSFK